MTDLEIRAPLRTQEEINASIRARRRARRGDIHWLGARGAVIGATVSGGDWSTVSGGDRSTVSGGAGSIMQIQYWDGKRRRIATGYVGGNGIKPDTPYRLNDQHEFVEVPQ